MTAEQQRSAPGPKGGENLPGVKKIENPAQKISVPAVPEDFDSYLKRIKAAHGITDEKPRRRHGWGF